MFVSQEKLACSYDLLDWAIKLRQPVSIAVILACGMLLFTTPLSWKGYPLLRVVLDALGLGLVVVAVFGRIWCSLYISGYKEDRVVSEGPYAIVRNPLYVFSFIGAIGLGLTAGHLLILAIIAGAFLLYYPVVVLAEERHLQRKFGLAYESYLQQVPRFLPRRFTLIEPDTYPVRPRHVRRSLQEIIWFLWFYLVLHLTTVLQ
jgi:protein-S-isoprenylcysteine O-methyltransferase Ste14